jgi:hypothetical protein
MDKLVLLLIEELVIPELILLVRGNPNITEEELKVEFRSRVDRVVSVGQMYLDSTKPTN